MKNTDFFNIDREVNTDRQKAVEAFRASQKLEQEQIEFILNITNTYKIDLDKSKQKVTEYIKTEESKRGEYHQDFFNYDGYATKDYEFDGEYLIEMRAIWNTIIFRDSALRYLLQDGILVNTDIKKYLKTFPELSLVVRYVDET